MASQLTVRDADPGDATACREFILCHPQGNIFHTWEWFQAVMASMPPTTVPCYLLAFQGSEIVGLLPAIVSQVFEQPVLRTLPWALSVREALLSTSWAVSKTLLDACLERCLRYDVMAAQLLLPAGEERAYIVARADKPAHIVSRFSQIVMLPESYDTQWTEIYDGKTRNILRKARRKVTLKMARDANRLSAYYRLYKDTMSYTENANHLYPESLLTGLWRYFAPQHLELAEAYHNDQLIGGAIILNWKDSVHYWSAAGVRAHRSLNATSHILDSIIQRAVEQRYRQLNMGPSINYGSGLYRFKRQFGASYLDCDTVVVRFRPDGLVASVLDGGTGRRMNTMPPGRVLDVGKDNGRVKQELLSLTPRRRISLSKRHLPEEGVWLVYAVDGAEEARLATEAQKHGPDLQLEPEKFQGNLLRFNRTGLAIWELCDGTVSVAEVVEEIAQRCGIPQSDALADVTAFVQELARRDLMDLTWSPL